MGGTERQQRLYLIPGRLGAAALTALAFGGLYLADPTPQRRNMLLLLALFGLTVPLSWLALKRFDADGVTRLTLAADLLLVAAFTWALEDASLLAVPYFAPVAFTAFLFGARETLAATALAAVGVVAVSTLLDLPNDTVVPDLVALGATGGILAAVSRESQRTKQALAVERERDAAALTIARRLQSAAESETVLQRTVEELGRAVGAARCLLRLRQHRETGPHFQWTREGFPPLATPYHPAIRTVFDGEHVVVRDVEQDTDGEGREYLRANGVAAAVAYPVVWQDQVIAALGFHDDRPRDWSDALPLLERIVPQVAAALAQADLLAQREELVANVSHELRTPLTATIGFLKTLEREDVHLDPEQRREFIGVARREAERLGRLVADLLHLTRLERGTVSLAREPTSISALVARAVRGLEPPEGRTIRVDVPEALVVDVDADRMLQVVSNLVSNGLRHGSGDVAVGSEESADAVRLAVEDEGPGVDPAHVEKMFEPFARWSRHHDSSGLGLAIARRLVEAHGGTLTYRPREGARSHAFVVELPR